MATRPYLGHVPGSGLRWQYFRSATAPTVATHGDTYRAVWGPFRTARGARWAARACQTSNPHVQHVADAERLAVSHPF